MGAPTLMSPYMLGFFFSLNLLSGSPSAIATIGMSTPGHSRLAPIGGSSLSIGSPSAIATQRHRPAAGHVACPLAGHASRPHRGHSTHMQSPMWLQHAIPHVRTLNIYFHLPITYPYSLGASFHHLSLPTGWLNLGSLIHLGTYLPPISCTSSCTLPICVLHLVHYQIVYFILYTTRQSEGLSPIGHTNYI